ncbi:MAG: hypothetical protein WAP74_02145 [Patescibacteria group bacterium]
MFEKGNLTFYIPLEKPTGKILDPTDIRVSEDGVILIPHWIPANPDHTAFRLHFMRVPSLRAACRQCQHILRNYKQLAKGITFFLSELEFAMALYLDWDREQFREQFPQQRKRLLKLARWLERSRLPYNLKARSHIIEVIRREGRDAKGRYNPQAIASIIFASLFRLEQGRVPSMQYIVAEVASRQAVLELTHEFNLAILLRICNELLDVLKNRLFQSDVKPANRWYNDVITEFIQIAVLTRRLWGAPFTQVAIAINNSISKANELLEGKSQTDAKLTILELIDQLKSCPRSLKALGLKSGGLRRSQAWKARDFAGVRRQLEIMSQAINELPSVLDYSIRPLRDTLMQIEGRLTRGEWEKATPLLESFRARCEW